MAAKFNSLISNFLRLKVVAKDRRMEVASVQPIIKRRFNSFQAKAKFEKYNQKIKRHQTIGPFEFGRTFRRSKTDALRKRAIHNNVKANLSPEERITLKKIQKAAEFARWKAERKKQSIKERTKTCAKLAHEEAF